MKKLTLLFFLIASKLFALPVGNPSDPLLLCNGLFWENCCEDPCCSVFTFRFGFYGNYVFSKHLEAKNDLFPLGRRILDAKMNTNAAYLVLGLFERIDLFATLGSSKLSFKGELFLLDPSEFETEDHFSWTIGARAIVWHCGLTSLNVEAQYFAWKPHVNRISFPLIDSSTYPRGLVLNWQEWQFSLGISRKIYCFVPFFALKYGRTFSKFRIDVDRFVPFPFFTETRFKSQRSLGYALGTTLIDLCKMDVTLEALFGNEKAFHLNWQIRF